MTGRQHCLCDVNPPGIGVRVSAAGVKSYVNQCRFGGGPERRVMDLDPRKRTIQATRGHVRFQDIESKT